MRANSLFVALLIGLMVSAPAAYAGMSRTEMERILDRSAPTNNSKIIVTGDDLSFDLHTDYDVFKDNVKKKFMANGMSEGNAVEAVGKMIKKIDKVFEGKFKDYKAMLDAEKEAKEATGLYSNCEYFDNKKEWKGTYTCQVLSGEFSPDPWYTKAWFWVPVVLVVVGGAAAGVGIKLSMDSNVQIKEYGGVARSGLRVGRSY